MTSHKIISRSPQFSPEDCPTLFFSTIPRKNNPEEPNYEIRKTFDKYSDCLTRCLNRCPVLLESKIVSLNKIPLRPQKVCYDVAVTFALDTIDISSGSSTKIGRMAPLAISYTKQLLFRNREAFHEIGVDIHVPRI